MRLPAPPMPGWLERLVPFERYAIEIYGRRVHVMEAGDRRARPVLLLHGNPTWSFLWRKVARALSREPLRIVMPDLIGLGLSEKPWSSSFHTLETHAAHIGGLVDELDLEGVIFGGQDWGGPIGLLAFADPKRRKRLAGMVILNTAVGPPRPEFKATKFHRFARMPIVSEVAFRLLGFPQNALAAVQGDRDSIKGDVAHAYRWPLRRITENAAPLALARMVPDSVAHESVAGLVRCKRLVEGFQGPSAIVWGKRDPVLGRLLERTKQALPHARVTATQAGHFLQEEVPGEIAEAIRYVAKELGPTTRARRSRERRRSRPKAGRARNARPRG